MISVEQRIKSSLAKGVVLFDANGDLDFVNSTAAGMLWESQGDESLYEQLTKMIGRVFEINESRECNPPEMIMKSDDGARRIKCSIKRVLGDRYRAILLECSGTQERKPYFV